MSENPVKCTVNPYICSSDEFIDERKVLGAKVFPALNSLALQRGTSFSPYDWDINLNDDQLQHGLSLDLALKSIKRSSPFFIALVGEDYGIHRHASDPPLSLDEKYDVNTLSWLEKTLLIAASNGNEWILSPDYNSTSLFELKIIAASFEDTSYCRYYVKDTGSISNTSQVSDEVDYKVFKQKQLRSNLAKRGLFVTYYTTVESLCSCITEDWVKIITQLYPPLNTIQLDQYHQLLKRQKRFIYKKMGNKDSFGEFMQYNSKENGHFRQEFLLTQTVTPILKQVTS